MKLKLLYPLLILLLLGVGTLALNYVFLSNKKISKFTQSEKVQTEQLSQIEKKEKISTLIQSEIASKPIDNQLVINSAKLLAGIEKEGQDYTNYIRSLPYYTRKISYREIKAMPKNDRPDLAMEFEYLKTFDPSTKTIPRERLFKADQIIKEYFKKNKEKVAIAGVKWQERGPDNVGGRTRAIMFDPNDLTRRKVWAGGVTGGLWFNNDITLNTSGWVKVDDFWANLGVTSIAFAPNNTQTFYVGTGESPTFFRGGGIWKTTNGGNTWTQLTSTQVPDFFYISKIIVNADGIVIVATRNGILRSDNGGTSWTKVLNGDFADVELAADGDMYCSNHSGVIFKSINAGNTWTNLNINDGGNRVEIACAPSDQQVLYAVAEGGNASQDVEWVKKSIDGGDSWTDLPIPLMVDGSGAHFTRGQAWYDLILAVHPANANIVLMGGIDIHRSINGGTTWSGISHWYGGFSRPYVHADQHAIVFRPDNFNTVVFGNDGGVHFSTNAGNNGVTAPSFSERNRGYNVTQFYATAAKNEDNSNFFLAGAQDNGTQRFSESGSMSTSEAFGGDGGFCFIDQQDANYQIVSYVYNNYYLSTNNGASFNTTLVENDNAGQFINPADYDNTAKILYSGAGTNQFFRINNITTNPTAQTAVNIALSGGSVSAIRANAFLANRIFIGTDNGRVFKVDNAHSNAPVATEISGVGQINNGYVSNIDIGANDDELIITISNYNRKSVYYTSNGGTNWISKDESTHGLPDMPVRWALFNPNNTKQVLLATEMGVWTTDDITATNPGWEPSNTTLANVRCDMLKFRSADRMVVVATHGRGLFTSDVFVNPKADFIANKRISYLNTAIQFTDKSAKVTSYSWNFGSGASPATANTKGPHNVTYSSIGQKTVGLTGNSNLVNTKNNFIQILPSEEPAYLLANGGNFETEATDFGNEPISTNLNFVRGNSTVIGKDGTSSGNFAWVTNALGNYPDLSEARLYTPNFDFSRAGTYTLEFKTKFKTEEDYDGFIVEFSLDKGLNWTRLGNSVANGWYNSTKQASGGFSSSTPFFSGSTTGFETKTFDVSSLAGNGNVAFRFVFKSDEAVNDAGVAIDDFQIKLVDPFPPLVNSFNPAHQATGVAVATNLVINFSEKIQKGSGNIVIKKLSDNSIFETIAITSAQVTINERAVTINPNNNLAFFTDYYVEISAGAFKDLANNNFEGISGSAEWQFKTIQDNIAPVLQSFTPTNNATNVALETNLTLTFDENIQKGSGNLLINKLSDNSTIATINLGGNEVTINGATATINPTNNLPASTQVYVLIPSGGFKDLAGNNYAGISINTTWRFTTLDNIPPTHTALNPANGAIDIPQNANLVITFDENIQKGSGNILIKKLSDNSIVETINVTNAIVSINNNIATINPANNLAFQTDFFVEIPSGAFKDLANNNHAGFTNNSTWKFKTIADPNSLEDQILAQNTLLYPNPSSGLVNLQIKNLIVNQAKLSVLDSQGKVLFEKVYNEITDNQVLNLSNLPTGTYFLKIQTDKGKTIKSFIKQ
jgi:photosystem II stability/assembly factor-like uncharacterized protein/methionine-rich copper-binding protein CopC